MSIAARVGASHVLRRHTCRSATPSCSQRLEASSARTSSFLSSLLPDSLTTLFDSSKSTDPKQQEEQSSSISIAKKEEPTSNQNQNPLSVNWGVADPASRASPPLSQAAIAYQQRIVRVATRGNGAMAQGLLLEYYDRFENPKLKGATNHSRSSKGVGTKTMSTDYENTTATLMTTYVFNIVLRAWAFSKDQDATDKAEMLFKMMLREFESGNMPYAKPNMDSYRCMIKCWSSRSNPSHPGYLPHAVDNLLVLLNELRQKCIDGEITRQIPAIIYYELLLAFSNKGAFDMVYSILKRQIDDYKAGIAKDPPSAASLRIAAKCWSLSKDPRAPQHAEEILDIILNEGKTDKSYPIPDVPIYNSIIFSWSNSSDPDAPEHAQRIFDKLLLAQTGRDGTRLSPNTWSYGNVINTWAKSKLPGSIQRAEDLFLDMRQRALDDDKNLSLNIKCYGVIANAYADIGEAEGAMNMLRMAYEDFKAGHRHAAPNTIIYTSVIKALNNSSSSDSAEKVEELLREMRERSQSEGLDCEPNSYTYFAAIKSWTRSNREDAAERAEKILREAQEEYIFSSNSSWATEKVMYITVCESLARSGRDDSHERILALIEYIVDKKQRQPIAAFFAAALEAIVHQSATDKKERVRRVLLAMEDNNIRRNERIDICLKKLGIVKFDSDERPREGTHRRI